MGTAAGAVSLGNAMKWSRTPAAMLIALDRTMTWKKSLPTDFRPPAKPPSFAWPAWKASAMPQAKPLKGRIEPKLETAAIFWWMPGV